MASFRITGRSADPQVLAPFETGRVAGEGVLDSGSATAVTMSFSSRLTVDGAIRSSSDTVAGDGGSIRIVVKKGGSITGGSDAIAMTNASNLSIQNFGSVASTSFGRALDVNASGRVLIENHGSMTSSASAAIWNVAHGASQTTTIINTGEIAGQFAAVRHWSSPLVIENSGIIRGTGSNGEAINSFNFHADKIVNTGKIVGSTSFNAGANIFDGSNGVQGKVSGGNGSDTLIGGAKADELHGGTGGNNLLYGGGGKDVLYGGSGSGSNKLFGQGGADTLYGGLGSDVLKGGAGDDMIFAVGGANRLHGGKGNDTLVAGQGQDTLIGGAGADVFVFATAKSASLGKLNDLVVDFTTGVDVIDLSPMMGNRAFSFLGDAAFSGTRGELRYEKATGLLAGDTNGNGVANFMIQLAAGTALQEADVLL